MKKNLSLATIILGVILISVSFVSASWWSDLFSGDKVTGNAINYQLGARVKEQVKCVFSDSTTTQQCSSSKGSCKGVGTCLV